MSTEITENLEKLFAIAKEGNVAAIHSFLSATDTNINTTGTSDETALMLAIKGNDVVATECLVAAGADIDRGDMKGNTALMLAASHGHIECLEFLLKAGASKSQTNVEGKTALMFAVLGRQIAELNGNIEKCTEILIDAGVDVNVQDKEGKTALMLATENSWGRKCIPHLIAAGADASMIDSDGRTALMLAAAKFDLHDPDEIVIRSSMCGIDDFIDPDVFLDETVNKDKVIMPLIRASSDLNKQDKHGHTALMIACATRHLWCVIRLVLAGADMNIRDLNGRTALMYSTMYENCYAAEKYEDPRVISLLLENGADVNVQDNNGTSALMFACRSGYLQTIRNLIVCGADTERTDDNKRTALIHALEAIKMAIASPRLRDRCSHYIYSLSCLLHEGATPVLSEEFQPLLDEISEGYLMETYCNFYLIQFLIINGATYFRYNYSPCLDRGMKELVPYLIANCCIYDEDLKMMMRNKAEHDSDDKKFTQEVVSYPWPLVKLAFVAVSSAIGHNPGREKRVRQTGLPLPIQECLLFRRPVALVPVHHWKDIPLCFNPVEYESLPEPRPLLYNWPFGRKLVTCECERCHGKGLNFKF